MRPLQVIILAAGKGTRMRSRLPKVAHRVAGRAMLEHVLRAASDATLASTVADAVEGTECTSDAEDHSPRFDIVVGHERETVQQSVRWSPPAGRVNYVLQEEQLGTGHAVYCAQPELEPGEVAPATVLVLYGDTPIVQASTLRTLLNEHDRTGATLTFLTAIAETETDYGRVLRDVAGCVAGIIEVKHATPEELAIREVNSGIYCFDAAWLWSRLEHLEPHPNGELYLTDLIEIAVREGQRVSTTTGPLDETMGVNDRIMLAEAERILQGRILRELMLAGVTVRDPATTYVELGVTVGQDSVLLPGAMLQGKTTIGERCTIGPNSVIRDSQIGDDCAVLASWVEESTMEAHTSIGPMSHLRPGAYLCSGAKLGNFAEVKKSIIGPNVQMHHFSYLGDATVGARTNIAAGTITANFAPDGTKRHTEIGEDVFIGCDTIMRAPVTIGTGARTGAGAIVTRDVPPHTTAVGMPARVMRPRQEPATDSSADTDPAGTDSADGVRNAEVHKED
jgi:bifunctional UDP-N-acetylglucosamine pyrophosphorylase/glucosamine-1-phosphate N-acetyltransferase